MYVSSTHEFKENVPVVYAFQKTLKKIFLKFLLYVLTSKIGEHYANRINGNFK